MPRFDGPVTRDHHPRVNVLRGYTGNEPQSLSRSAPVATGVTIESGMAIALDGNGEWVLADNNDGVVYIAYHDSTDTDVLSGGSLLGFSTLGQYELETGWFVDPDEVTGAGLVIQASTTPGSFCINGGTGAAAPNTALGRSSVASIDLADSASVKGGNPPLGEDDSAPLDVGGNAWVVRFTTTAS